MAACIQVSAQEPVQQVVKLTLEIAASAFDRSGLPEKRLWQAQATAPAREVHATTSILKERKKVGRRTPSCDFRGQKASFRLGFVCIGIALYCFGIAPSVGSCATLAGVNLRSIQEAEIPTQRQMR